LSPRNIVGRDNYGDGVVVGMVDPGTFSADLDIPFRQGSFELGVPEFGGFSPESGLRFGMAILSDIEAFLFVQAAQGDERANLMFAPKITLFNGQIASISSFVARPFVTSVIPVVSAFAVGFQPVITQVPDGIFMTVQAVVSADRRYVRLAVSPNFQNVTDVFTFSFVSGAQPTIGGQGGGNIGGGGGGLGGGGGGFGGGGGGGFGGGGGGGGFGGGGFGGGGGGNIGGQQGQQGQQGGTGGGSITVQQPVSELVNVSTVVSVPDGGTVLLGGIKRLREGRSMNGVPILNKIPYVSRLFKNTGVGRETESLMLMVTPRIIIQEEEEELLGQ
jgi:Flp pilus assembly secretin CpaC